MVYACICYIYMDDNDAGASMGWDRYKQEMDLLALPIDGCHHWMTREGGTVRAGDEGQKDRYIMIMIHHIDAIFDEMIQELNNNIAALYCYYQQTISYHGGGGSLSSINHDPLHMITNGCSNLGWRNQDYCRPDFASDASIMVCRTYMMIQTIIIIHLVSTRKEYDRYVTALKVNLTLSASVAHVI